MTHPPPDPERRSDLLWLGAVGLVVTLACLRGGFALDDRELLGSNPVVTGAAPWWTAFTRDYFAFLGGAGQWRPLSSLSLRLDHALFGPEPAGYHLVGAALHLAAVALALAWRRPLGIPAGAARAGLTLFALHPLLADSVVWIAGRTSALSVLGPLAAGAWLLPRVAAGTAGALGVGTAAGLGVLLGLLGKEEAVVMVPALALAVLRASRQAPGRARHLAGAALVGGLLALLVTLVARGLALGELLPAAPTPALGAAPVGERLLVGGNALLEALRLVVLPLEFPPRFRVEALLAAHEPPGPRLAAGLGWALLLTPFTVAALLARRGRAPGPAAASAMLAALALWPLTQLLPTGEVLVPRALYLPLLLGAPAAGALLARLAGRHLALATGGLLLVLGAGLFHRAAVYAGPESWHRAMLAHHPDDAPTWNALGLVREEEGDADGALEAWRHAIRLDPAYSKPWSNLGRLQLERGELEEAERSLRGAVAAGPRNAVARVNLAALLSRTGRLEEAVAVLRESVELAPTLAPAWSALGQALQRCGRDGEAREALRRALALDPGDRRAQTLLGREAAPPAPPPR